MAHSHTTLSDARSEVLASLSDPSGSFWSASEIDRHIRQAIRVHSALTRYHRKAVTFATSANQPYYSLRDIAATAHSITSSDLLAELSHMLLEPESSFSWTGSAQFTEAGLASAMQGSRDTLLSSCACSVSPRNVTIPDATGIIPLPDDVLLIRRVVYNDTQGTYATAAGTKTVLYPSSERALSSNLQGWPGAAGAAPSVWSVYSRSPLTLRLYPAPADGRLELLAVVSGADVDFSASSLISLPDDLCWGVLWGVLQEILDTSGPSADRQRASFASSIYSLALEAGSVFPRIANAWIGSNSLMTGSLDALDQIHGWMNESAGTPAYMGISADSMWLYPTPDGVYTVNVETAVSADVPLYGNDFLQIPRDDLEAVVNWAEMTAGFKMGGAEAMAMRSLGEEMVRAAVARNSQLDAESDGVRYFFSDQEKARKPERTAQEEVA